MSKQLLTAQYPAHKASAEPCPAHDLLDGIHVGLDDRVLEPAAGLLAHVAAGVHVDDRERLGVVEDQVAAGLEGGRR